MRNDRSPEITGRVRGPATMTGSRSEVRVRRVYGEREPRDGTRVLVDRLWPRGLTKAAADLDEWCKQVSPSTDLRNWYHHEPALLPRFADRYRIELEQPERAAALEHLRVLARAGTLTLLTAVKQPEISHAQVLADLLNG